MRKKIGTVLIVLSLILLTYTYFPLISLYFFPTPISASQLNSFSIHIPKISAHSPIIENIDPWDEDGYKNALKSGVAHAKNTALPGTDGTIFLFAHSSLPPWEMTRVNTAFFRLNELKSGDQIKIFKDNKEFIYLVSDKKQVWPNEVSYLVNNHKNQLILQTCTPLGTALKRLLVFAEPTPSEGD